MIAALEALWKQEGAKSQEGQCGSSCSFPGKHAGLALRNLLAVIGFLVPALANADTAEYDELRAVRQERSQSA